MDTETCDAAKIQRQFEEARKAREVEAGELESLQTDFERICKSRGIELWSDHEDTLAEGPNEASSAGIAGDGGVVMMAPLDTYSSKEWATLCFWHEVAHLEINKSIHKAEYEYERTLRKACNWAIELTAWSEAIHNAYQIHKVELTQELADKIMSRLRGYSKQPVHFMYKGEHKDNDDDEQVDTARS